MKLGVIFYQSISFVNRDMPKLAIQYRTVKRLFCIILVNEVPHAEQFMKFYYMLTLFL